MQVVMIFVLQDAKVAAETVLKVVQVVVLKVVNRHVEAMYVLLDV